MGKVTGFMEFDRLAEENLPVQDRVKNYKEFVLHLTDDQAKQQGARCMDCGIPFCTTGCPINNIIPDWNDLVYHQDWRSAIDVLHSTNNFPDFTGRICPAPCEAACTLNINNDAVGIKSIEHAIIDKAWENGWVTPQINPNKTGKTVAIVGSGPAGLAAAQQLARAGHAVTVFEKNDRIGGLLRYGIPDFKLDKANIDRRMAQMEAEGVTFKVNQHVGENVSAADLERDFDAVILAGGAEQPRDLPVTGRELDGVHFAMDFLTPNNKMVAGDNVPNQIKATGKHVVVIGGGDTGSDCVGTSNRHGAASITQFELMPQPPEKEDKFMVWPNWPLKMRTSSSHEEGANRDWSITTKELIGENGKVKALKGARVEWKDGKMSEIPGSEFTIPADLVFLAMGFVSPVQKVLEAFGVEKDNRGNAKATTDGEGCYKTSKDKVFAAGDIRRGQSLVVWAIREGRQCAREVDAFLMGSSTLPR
ncbi:MULTISPECIES: glutamate synthase subunit beta [unclassified Methylophilus]|uniref:glutamate synthase subunit beta n=1 Tax=unclassified Methylophilus TaxID=2630143 RepID=UPI00188DF27F|nr:MULTISPECIES: glutamate synthase subunit beta [unclassified Methylophilus]MBF5040645.1 glutamate synthase subunit beta [Methylophilus sp. 13]MDF0377920.1 glutamate synthase small subunit [Methylophilus sp. YYY-1]